MEANEASNRVYSLCNGELVRIVDRRTLLPRWPGLATGPKILVCTITSRGDAAKRQEFLVSENDLKVEGRNDVLDPPTLTRRVIRLTERGQWGWSGFVGNFNDLYEPNVSVWRAVLTDSTTFRPDDGLPPWLLQDKELLILAIKSGFNADSNKVVARGMIIPPHLVLDRDVLFHRIKNADVRRYDNLANFPAAVFDDESLQEHLIKANLEFYNLCFEPVRRRCALDVVPYMNDVAGSAIPEGLERAVMRKAAIVKGYLWAIRHCSDEADKWLAKMADETRRLEKISTKECRTNGISLQSMSIRKIADACIEIGEGGGCARGAAVLLRAMLVRRHFKPRNYTDSMITFLGAHLPEEDMQKVAEETRDACAKRDRAAFEADNVCV